MPLYISKLSQANPELPLIIHLSGGRWQIRYKEINSAPAKYEERIIDTFGQIMLCGQTEYYGKEAVWEIKSIMSNQTIDLS